MRVADDSKVVSAAPGAVTAADRLVSDGVPDVRTIEPQIVTSGHDPKSIKPTMGAIQNAVGQHDAVLVTGDVPGADGKPHAERIAVEGYDKATNSFVVREPGATQTAEWDSKKLQAFTKGTDGGEAVAIEARPEKHATTREVDALVAAAPAGMQRDARTAIPIVLDEAVRAGVTDRRHVAYMLATAEWESNFGSKMVEGGNGKSKDGIDHYFDKYDGRKDLGNDQPGDGEKYKGRGYVQVTGKKHYEEWSQKLGVDLKKDPERLTVQDVAGRVMVEGLRDGSFTGKSLSHYDTEKRPYFDAYDARGAVNGDKSGFRDPKQAKSNGHMIEDAAHRYDMALARTEISEQLPRMKAAGANLPEPASVANWNGAPRSGTFVKIDDGTFAMQTARGEYVLMDLKNDLHGQAPVEGQRMSIDAKGNVHEPKQPAQDRTPAR